MERARRESEREKEEREKGEKKREVEVFAGGEVERAKSWSGDGGERAPIEQLPTTPKRPALGSQLLRELQRPCRACAAALREKLWKAERGRTDGVFSFSVADARCSSFLRCSPCAAPSSRSAMRMNRGTIPGRLSCSHAPMCSLRRPDGYFCRVPFPLSLSLSLSLSLIKGARNRVRTERENRLPPLSFLLFFRKEGVFFLLLLQLTNFLPSPLSLSESFLSRREEAGARVYTHRGASAIGVRR